MTEGYKTRFGACVVTCFALGLGLLPARPAQAQDCPPLKRITSVKMERLGNYRRLLVPVTVNGVPRKFLLDTAGMTGFITREAADEMKMEHPSGINHIRIVKSFGLGGANYDLPATISNDTTLVSAEHPVSEDKDGDIDGTLTNGFLLNKGELDIDFPTATLSLFSPDHCPGKVAYWGAPDIGSLPLSYDIIPLNGLAKTFISPNETFITSDITHLTVPVTLDGHKLNAWIDTSQEKSTISQEVAQKIFGLGVSDLSEMSESKVTPEAAMGFKPRNMYGPVAGKIVTMAPSFRHRFGALSVGHIDIKNLEMLVIPDRWGRNNDPSRWLLYMPKRYTMDTWKYDIAESGDIRGDISKRTSGILTAALSNTTKDEPDMVLGMDVLRHLHVYLSLKEKKMYLSAGAPAPAPAK